MSSRSIKGSIALATAFFAGGLFLGGAVRAPSPLQTSNTPIPARPAAMVANHAAPTGLTALSDAFANVAETIRPSVVFIESHGKSDGDSRAMRVPPGLQPYFRGFPQGPERGQEERRSGSGFIISADGVIVTNAHVVENSDQVKVRLLDHREFPATVVGSDPNTDIAVLRIKADGLHPVPLGDSDAARIGEWVLAVGNPLGENLSFTVTSGIISAKGRSLALPNQTDRSIQDFIQTDAAINPGNSGGPLVDVLGNVIGVNAAIASETGFYSGYGFAIPINLARQVVDQIQRSGKVHRAALGIKVRDATQNDAAYVGLDRVRGVVVQDIGGPDSPAAKAGLQLGDVIVAIDGKDAEYVGQLQQAVAFRRPGDKVSVEVARKGGVHATVKIPLQEVGREETVARDDSRGESDAEPGSASRASVPALGLTLGELTRQDAAQLELPAGIRGVAVTDVDPNGPCAERVAEPDQGEMDILVAVEGQSVRTVTDVKDLVRRQRPGSVIELRLFNTHLKNIRIERVRMGGN